jgi:hypothetical protein
MLQQMILQFGKNSVPIQQFLKQPNTMKIFDDFESLPIKFMNYSNSMKLEEMLKIMEEAVERDDVQHIILDNIQSIYQRCGPSVASSSPPSPLKANLSTVNEVPNQSPSKEGNNIPSSTNIGSGEKLDEVHSQQRLLELLHAEKLSQQDRIIERLRQFAIEKNVKTFFFFAFHPDHIHSFFLVSLSFLRLISSLSFIQIKSKPKTVFWIFLRSVALPRQFKKRISS